MNKKKLAICIGVPLIAAPLLAACGSSDSGSGSGSGKSGSSSSHSSSSSSYGKSSSPSSGASSAGLKTASSSYGKIVVDGKGMTAYYYDKDKPNSGKSVCKGECAAEWPPVNSKTSTPKVKGVSGTVKTIKGSDGGKQLTVNGRPVYAFADDAKPGDVKGQGIEDNTWHVISPSGHEIMAKAK
jgi:predicted lipoprotein with Yx(FWY)xxD motif